MQKIPEPLHVIVEQFARLPGFGPKSAMRAAMALLKWPETEARRLGQNISSLRDNLHICSRCGALAEKSPCALCTDPSRKKNTLCLVAEWDSMLTMEEGAFFKGLYFILGGSISPLDGAGSLEMARLHERLAENEIDEIIFALGATAEAEATAAYVREEIGRRFPHIRITRLAQGIPLGAEVKFMDRETLRQSLQFRQEL